MRKMVTERYNIAARMIDKAISKDACGGNMVFTDIGGTAKKSRTKKALLPPNRLQT